MWQSWVRAPPPRKKLRSLALWVASLANKGAVLVCGGLGGVMEAACRGAKESGGTTVGILPGPDRHAANLYVDIAIATGLGEARNAVVVGCADAVIAVGGEFGTLSEIALALWGGKTRGGPRDLGAQAWWADIRRDRRSCEPDRGSGARHRNFEARRTQGPVISGGIDVRWH